ncbi:NADH dehydrogenase/NADH:ubiquinone oxidoreductase subunit G [Chitinivorax tropicus]|uniref:NADH dehydrogenase/NADH:ubiquinone oxidoreductase subunit G n=1 Tax=Chitinivorax tropicus TaxID=714531 RepID=A0A840MIB3_9PROT|nr:type IV pili methyl-accepting chemotaxis transducer N-terminal domain-containing protein [Chitinivorax tropicus]MBB5018140.1 NADH dehydrogenase/NADH:ubiquinone oxidoreductase subunit G [Chitinivorax tropicus]
MKIQARTTHRFFIFALAALVSASAYAAEIPYPDLINKAGRQRMLSQRIVKAYLQLGANVLPEQGRQVLNESMKTFEQQLADLKQADLPANVDAAIEKEEQQWKAFRELVSGPVTQVTARKLQSQSDSLLATANEVTLALQDAYGQPSGKFVNLAGRQRMLSQMLSRQYLAKFWGVTQADGDKVIQEARGEFNRNLTQLSATPNLSNTLKQQLDLASQQWVFLDMALTQPHNAGNAQNVVSTSERILEVLDNVTQRFEKSK